MIIDFELNVNTYENFLSENCDLIRYYCPKCGCKHLVKHAIYLRNLVLLKDNIFSDEKFTIHRVICTSCGSTHAILPNDVIPYCIYSFSLILHMLYSIFVSGNSVLCIANKFNISFQLIYSFIARFTCFFNECIQCLKILEVLFPKNITKTIVIKLIFDYINLGNNFLKQYLFNFKWCFMMTKFHNMNSPPISIGTANRVT